MPYWHNRVKHIDLQDILFLDSVVMKYLYAVFFALVFSGFVLPTAVAQTTMEKEIWKIDDNRQNEPVQEAPIEVSSKDGSIYIRTPRKVQVIVYTILGQIVTSLYTDLPHFCYMVLPRISPSQQINHRFSPASF